MISILKAGGLNKYKVPHMKKYRLEGQNCLPKQLDVDPALIGEAIAQYQQVLQLTYLVL
ncbi:hypothetical protein Patl1_13086 [Pistacia atlantica]|uniref:Uncharacterized protein n=1 Tax=Pistacia atlantica TaxID=434234 RepID=A0ACC1AU06_9ROSI|nr:hypothetical protein Patl1_13086 [Pistacia atlantica]